MAHYHYKRAYYAIFIKSTEMCENRTKLLIILLRRHILTEMVLKYAKIAQNQ
jgi:hypothetical protein